MRSAPLRSFMMLNHLFDLLYVDRLVVLVQKLDSVFSQQ